jgi:hypothetical protein
LLLCQVVRHLRIFCASANLALISVVLRIS